MASVDKVVSFSWIPKGGGKGGQFSNATSHDVDSDQLSSISNFLVEGAAWVAKTDDLLFSTGIAGNGYPWSLAVFNSFSATNQRFYSFLMAGYVKQTALAGWGRGYFVPSGTFTALDVNGAGSKSGFFNYPAIFQSVKNRCYSCDGMTTVQVAGGLVGPRIYYDSTGLGTTLTGVNWGLPTPIPNLQAVADPNSYQTGTCNTTAGSPNVTALSFDPRTNLAEGMPFYIESSAGSGQYYEYIILACTGATTLTLTTNSINTGTGSKCQGNYGSLTFGQAQPNIVTGTGTTTASLNVTSISGFDAQVYAKKGYRLLIETSAGSQVWNTYIIDTVPNPTSVTLLSPTVENYAGARIRLDLPATSSGISSDSSYQYAISYYDSARGHIGNPGPILTVNWGPPFNKRVNLKIQNITDAPLQGGAGKLSNNWTYDKIILWRTAANGAVLQSRVLLSPAGGGGTQSFVDNQSDDTQLGLVGPVGAGISSKLTAHSPPPSDLNFATYWEGRFFGASSSNPGVLYWTALDGQEVDFYGVPEECWPPLNTLTVSESDGAITGLRTVGSSLVLLTQNNIYEVAYNTSNSTAIFRLKRLSAKGLGTSHFATATLPGEDSQSGDILVHFGNDKRLYLLYGAGGDIPISYPVQDVFNAFQYPERVRVGVRHDDNATYIVVMPNQGTNLVYSGTYTYLYDLDRKIWLTVAGAQSCYTEALFDGVTTAFLGGGTSQQGQPYAGNVYKMSAGTSPPTAPLLVSSHYITPPGVPRMDEKTLQAVIVWADHLDSGVNFFVNASADEGGIVALTRLNATTTPFLQMYMDTPNCSVYVPSSATPLSGRTFMVRTFLNQSQISPPRLYEVMAYWSVTVEDGARGGVL